MTHTEDTLRGLSDFERNKILAVLLGFKLSNWLNNNFGHVEIKGSTCITPVTDYCTNAGVTMPLAFKHKIGVEFIDGFGWTASHAYDLTSASCYDNPLRAVVMCLILHLQGRGV